MIKGQHVESPDDISLPSVYLSFVYTLPFAPENVECGHDSMFCKGQGIRRTAAKT